ncbi:DHH family phosphoesterase [Dokdonia sp. Hel_I_53]|uniref:DHH family phosphoesterase n=1 Tax=Dokdonia sp. Hel_I_53 TaxID=1566287 RepID=UPI00119B226F|nr:bifunctional oligoribonuclease/PAP phosphatase NrnA [Dokdonia sp. Hel_I_53]TVZ53426.1 phosphoesterase RecJ-like protein [Dokdonia sp. Hel_I_53]
MNEEQIAMSKSLLSGSKNIAIIPHKNPDGDAMGSTLALASYLNKKGHKATVVSPNEYPHFLQWLPGNDQAVNYNRDIEIAQEIILNADLVFTLDFNHFSRTGDLQNELEQVKAPFVMIDHHQQPADYAIVTYSDTAMSSTCEMVFHFIKALGDQDMIDSEMASCLYTGIMTDTGSFRFPSTTATTHRVIASLIDKGAENSKIHEKIYDTNSESKLQLLGVALNNLVVLKEYRTAYITMSQKELDDHNFQKGDTEGFVNYCLSLQGIIFAVIFIENLSDSIIKMSLRSKGTFSVNEFARTHYQGGGHTNAAGGKSDLGLQETVAHFKTLLPRYKEQLT